MVDHSIFCALALCYENKQKHYQISHDLLDILLQLKSACFIELPSLLLARSRGGKMWKKKEHGRSRVTNQQIRWERYTKEYEPLHIYHVKTRCLTVLRITMGTEIAAKIMNHHLECRAVLEGLWGKQSVTRSEWACREEEVESSEFLKLLRSQVYNSPTPLTKYWPYFIFVSDFYVT